MQYVWACKKHGLVNILYFATRYLAFVDALIIIVGESLRTYGMYALPDPLDYNLQYWVTLVFFDIILQSKVDHALFEPTDLT